MKKLGFMSLTLLIFVILNFAFANAAVKSGTSCKKLNQISIYAGKKYTCIKNGNKLIWNKGVIVRNSPSPEKSHVSSIVPTPAGSISPVPTISPSPSSSASPSANVRKQPQSKEDFYYQNLLFQAWEQQLNLNRVGVKPEIIRLIDPIFPKVSLNSISEGMNSVLLKYGYLIKPDTRVYVIFSSNYDFEINSIQNNSELQADYLKEDPNWSRHIWRIEQYKNKSFVSGGTYPISGSRSYVIYFRLSSDKESDDWRYLGAHETTHLIQWMINGNFPKVLPAWWIEGQAQQAEEVLGNEKQTLSSIDEEMARLSGHFGPSFLPNSPDGKDFFNMEGDSVTRTEFGCKLCSTDLIYSRGKLAIDYLISVYSHDKVISFMQSLSSSNLWWQTFEKTFGISIPDFYKKLEGLVDWYSGYYVKK